jgi:hypothetical protein
MKQTAQIDFVNNTSTREAIIYTLRFQWHIIKNITKVINMFAHSFPWVLVLMVLAVSMIVSFVKIGQARAERDSIDHKMVTMQRQLDSYRAICEGKEVK